MTATQTDVQSSTSEGSSSSRTARDEGQATTERSSSSHSGGIVGGLVSTMSDALYDGGKSRARRTQDGSTSSALLPPPMSRTINTVPVFARHEQHKEHVQASTSRYASHASRQSTTRPARLHVADSTRAQTAVATRQAVGSDDNADTASIAASHRTSSSVDSGLGRFSSFTLRGSRFATSGSTNEHVERLGGNDGDADDEKKQRRRRKAPHSNALSSIVSAIRTQPWTPTKEEESRGAADAHSSSPVADDGDDENDEEDDENIVVADEDVEKHLAGAEEGARGGWSHDSSHDVNAGRRQRRARDGDTHSISRNYPLTPGWESPWRPESRGEHSIKFGKYRFNNFGEGGYFPHTDTRQSNASRKRNKGRLLLFGRTSRNGMSKSAEAEGGHGGGVRLLDVVWWRRFLLHNAFVPLLFRLINIAFTATTLAIATILWRLLKKEGAEDAVGSSPIVAIIFSPLTIAHVFTQTYIEYFSRPIGLWRVGSKLSYTMFELVFICLWSAELALAFDNYFTSTLVCSVFNSPFAQQEDVNPMFGAQALLNPSKKPYICRLQGALIGLVFTSLLAYVIVFNLMLFRIFVRLSKR